MRRFVTILLIVLLAISIAACGKKDKDQTKAQVVTLNDSLKTFETPAAFLKAYEQFIAGVESLADSTSGAVTAEVYQKWLSQSDLWDRTALKNKILAQPESKVKNEEATIADFDPTVVGSFNQLKQRESAALSALGQKVSAGQIGSFLSQYEQVVSYLDSLNGLVSKSMELINTHNATLAAGVDSLKLDMDAKKRAALQTRVDNLRTKINTLESKRFSVAQYQALKELLDVWTAKAAALGIAAKGTPEQAKQFEALSQKATDLITTFEAIAWNKV